MTHDQSDIIIVGGGLAGLTAALHLQKAGLEVLLVEKHPYPNHKVCGEYVSNEVLPYLQWLDADPERLKPNHIQRLQFTTVSGKSMTTALPLGGFGISRFKLDNFLYEQFRAKGGRVLFDTVTDIKFDNDNFQVSTSAANILSARQVIGAYGKRSAIDIKYNRPFIQRRSPWLAIKGHYSGNFEAGLVALHNFNGGYCGVSNVEDNKINICYLADYASFSRYKTPTAYQENVLYQNKHLKGILESSTPLFGTSLTISQIAFGAKETIIDHMLMIGDTAGLIHPLCGNGMGMAIHSAQMAANLLIRFFNGSLKTRSMLENSYTSLWNKAFKQRLVMGSSLSAILRKEQLADLLMSGMIRIPSILPMIIRKTHGKPLSVNITL